MQSVNILKHKPIEVTENLVRSVLDKQTAFAVYKDNYMVTGIPLNKPVNRKTADAFFSSVFVTGSPKVFFLLIHFYT
jgi:phospholipase A1